MAPLGFIGYHCPCQHCATARQLLDPGDLCDRLVYRDPITCVHQAVQMDMVRMDCPKSSTPLRSYLDAEWAARSHDLE